MQTTTVYASQPVEAMRLTACKQQLLCITNSCFWSCLRRLVKILKIEMLPELLVPMISCTVMDSETSGKFVRGRSYLMMYRFVRSSLAQWLPHKICSSLFLLFFFFSSGQQTIQQSSDLPSERGQNIYSSSSPICPFSSELLTTPLLGFLIKPG